MGCGQGELSFLVPEKYEHQKRSLKSDPIPSDVTRWVRSARVLSVSSTKACILRTTEWCVFGLDEQPEAGGTPERPSAAWPWCGVTRGPRPQAASVYENIGSEVSPQWTHLSAEHVPSRLRCTCFNLFLSPWGTPPGVWGMLRTIFYEKKMHTHKHKTGGRSFQVIRRCLSSASRPLGKDDDANGPVVICYS